MLCGFCICCSCIMLGGTILIFAIFSSLAEADNADCKKQQFSCISTNECVSRYGLCDGQRDCSDESDEIQPFCINVTSNFFNCKDGNKKQSWKACDGQMDCPDGSDEIKELCDGGTCHMNQFQCAYGACLYDGDRCDGVKHCADGSDESEEVCKDKQCAVNEFRCPNGLCLEKKKVCDRRQDCPDGLDESQPFCESIRRGTFRCADGAKKHQWQVCDGRKDCLDGSDETAQLCGNSTCHVKQFQCHYGACLHSGTSCDSKIGCADGSDESAETCISIPCKTYEFKCSYGACINEDLVCNGRKDCVDNSDELLPYCANITNGVLDCGNGTKARAFEVCDGLKNCPNGLDEVEELCGDIECHSEQFQCDSGGCLHLGQECDGNADCSDGSDEGYLLCRLKKCKPGEFRCTSGACVLGSSFCDGYRDCMDKSDEYHWMCKLKRCEKAHQFRCGYGACVKTWPCLNDGCIPGLRHLAQTHVTANYFRCQDDSTVRASDICNGVKDCADNSDEDTVLCNNIQYLCKNDSCKFSFPLTACDGFANCIDGSDESPAMCGSLRCMLPPYPEHGYYNASNVTPKDVLESLVLAISCDEGYAVDGDPTVFCNNGNWSTYPFPNCVRYCTFEDDPSIVYRCIDPRSESVEPRPCHKRELSGTIALPTCNGPNYYSPHALPHMTCVNGTWDATPNCTTECGKVTPSGQTLIAGGGYTELGELPWFAAIYHKEEDNYTHICGGSIVNNDVIISAAHCFWGYNSKLKITTRMPDHEYAVAAGKRYRFWDHSEDAEVQRSDVKQLILPKDFDGFVKNLQADIAIVIVSQPFEYKPHIRPICLSFQPDLDDKQLLPANKGKIAGFGLTTASGELDIKLKVVELPVVENVECNERSPHEFKEFLTLDKFCVGYWNKGISICRGDSGGGLAFPEVYNGVERYYLRGIASVQPRRSDNFDKCNTNAYSVMTHILKHETFIKQHF